MLTPGAQATVLLTVPFPGEAAGIKPLTPTEWGRFAVWLQARSLRPQSLLTSSLPDMMRELDDKTIRPERVEALLARGAALGLLIDKWSRAGIWVMIRADADYPPKLKRHLGAVSPAVLFGCGNRKLLSGGGLAVVGSRNAEPDDLAFSRRLGELAAGHGHSIISGAARGVDEAAMLGALESEGTAVGVLASDLLATSTAARYRDYITSHNLTFISTTNPEARFTVGNAMGRNRYIYCLADTAVVVHSGTKGGTWSGAVENLKMGWVALWVRDVADKEAGNRLLLNDPNARRLPADLGQLSFNDLFGAILPQPQTSDNDNTPPAEDNGRGLAPPLPDGARAATRDKGQDRPVGMLFAPNLRPLPPEMSLYDVFISQIQSLCRAEPCRPDELQQALELEKAQLDAWLKRAVAEGHLSRKTRPVRYQAISQADRQLSNQPRLFSD